MSSSNLIKIVGGLLPQQLLDRIAKGDATLPGTRPQDYSEDSANELNQAINRAWAALASKWASFVAARAAIGADERATVLTREKWLSPLFYSLGYGQLDFQRSALTVGDRTFVISHTKGPVPCHLVGAGVDLDKRVTGDKSAGAPHGMVQDFLNTSDGHTWGIVTNGLLLRVLRDHRSLTRQAYIEFDLQAMFDGEQFSAFRVLYLVLHYSRVEAAEPRDCWLEKWLGHAKDEGVRALDRLRDGVEAALVAFGSGFLKHRGNDALRSRLASGALTTQDYYRQLLRLAYRLIFLFVAEDRELLLDPKAPPSAKARYTRLYATRRVRQMAQRRRGGAHDDGWHALRLVMRQLDGGCPELALPALGSFLWGSDHVAGQRVARAMPDLDAANLTNEDLYGALRVLCTVQDGAVRRPVDWSGVQSDELGSVYEALMERVPRMPGGRFELATAAGNERKTTGSYYTPDALVQCLLDSALDPVVNDACKTAEPEQAILALKIVDPACGSGHFLVAAARRMAHRLARVRSGGIEPSPPEVQHALRDVVGRCIYGVDINPMAVELCKVSLWMEALEPGRPLSFLDAHIQCGNALLGATPELLEKRDAQGLLVGIPDEAFVALEGDDKPTTSEFKKRNKAARGQRSLFGSDDKPLDFAGLGDTMRAVTESRDEELADIQRKAAAYDDYLASSAYRRAKLLADAWCAAFVWLKVPGAPLLTNADFLGLREGRALPDRALAEVDRLAAQYQFFHWHLAFPEVFEGKGTAPVVAPPKPDGKKTGQLGLTW